MRTTRQPEQMTEQQKENWGIGRKLPMRFRNVKVVRGIVQGDVRVGHNAIGSEVWVAVKIDVFTHPEVIAPLEKILADTAVENVRFALDGRKTA
jgi:hypothetical protein